MPVCDPFRQDFRQYLIQDFYQNFDVLSGDTFFVGIGKQTPWTSATGGNRDNAPPKNLDCVKSDTDFWRTSFAFKKIQKSDVSIVVKRYDWAPNKVYDAYRDDVDLYDDLSAAKFYVLVDEERVYKCIDNNYGALSTVAPTHTDSQIRTLSDGYRWKYLYSISESKRKFLTKTQGSSLGYMPVEYVTRINENDDRELQYNVQNDAVDGSIDFIDLKQNLRNYTVSDRVLFFDASNQVAGATAAGATAVLLSGSNLIFQNDYYNNMTLRFESGLGSGQQRRIVDYYLNSSSVATAVLGTPLDYAVTAGAEPTLYSILPTVVVVGDGESGVNNLHTSATAAEITVSFLNSSATGSTDDSCPCQGASGARYLDRFELIDNGKNYTYASVHVVAGLTFTGGLSADMNLLAKAVMSPVGGHGSNAVRELGASTIMIVTDFNQDEECKLTTENDYRQFCLVKNPLLRKKQVRLYLSGPGLSNSFTVGATASQGFTGAGGVTGYDLARGKIVSWRNGAVGTTGTAELVLGNITGGTFEIGGFINGVTSQEILTVREKTVAGTEYRLLKRLKLVPVTTSIYDPSGLDFIPYYFAFGKGNSGDNVNASSSNGKIYKWQPESGTNTVGNLYLEDCNGSFLMSEHIHQMNNDYAGLSGPKGKIIEIDEYEETTQTVYDQTIRLNLNYDGTVQFDAASFEKDDVISNTSASGYVMDWVPATGATTGELRILPIEGNFQANQYLIYNNSGTTGGTISSVISEPELKYRSGTILHLQNLRPIERSPEQKEEIKLLIEF